jgi:hypothetical protein
MPFRSAKQRAFLRRRKPKIYQKWVREHGTTVVPTKKKRKGKKP